MRITKARRHENTKGRRHEVTNDRRRLGRLTRAWLLVAAAVVLAGGVAYALFSAGPAGAPPPVMRPDPAEATAEEVHRLCAACHAYPPADTFPRSAWRKEVQQGYDFFH